MSELWNVILLGTGFTLSVALVNPLFDLIIKLSLGRRKGRKSLKR